MVYTMDTGNEFQPSMPLEAYLAEGVKPRGKVSVLEPYADHIDRALASHLSYDQVADWLRRNGVEITRQSLHKWVQRRKVRKAKWEAMVGANAAMPPAAPATTPAVTQVVSPPAAPSPPPANKASESTRPSGTVARDFSFRPSQAPTTSGIDSLTAEYSNQQFPSLSGTRKPRKTTAPDESISKKP